MSVLCGGGGTSLSAARAGARYPAVAGFRGSVWSGLEGERQGGREGGKRVVRKKRREEGKDRPTVYQVEKRTA